MTNREWFTALCVLMHESEGAAGERLRDTAVEAEIGAFDLRVMLATRFRFTVVRLLSDNDPSLVVVYWRHHAVGQEGPVEMGMSTHTLEGAVSIIRMIVSHHNPVSNG